MRATNQNRPRDPALYARRNLLHAKSVGAHANALAALHRVQGRKAREMWLVEYLEGLVWRLEAVKDEMAKHRDEAW